jgi:hypothetical protein
MMRHERLRRSCGVVVHASKSDRHLFACSTKGEASGFTIDHGCWTTDGSQRVTKLRDPVVTAGHLLRGSLVQSGTSSIDQQLMQVVLNQN